MLLVLVFVFLLSLVLSTFCFCCSCFFSSLSLAPQTSYVLKVRERIGELLSKYKPEDIYYVCIVQGFFACSWLYCNAEKTLFLTPHNVGWPFRKRAWVCIRFMVILFTILIVLVDVGFFFSVLPTSDCLLDT